MFPPLGISCKPVTRFLEFPDWAETEITDSIKAKIQWAYNNSPVAVCLIEPEHRSSPRFKKGILVN
jgi:hypothetical protein